MRPDLDEALTRDFPCLYRERHGDRDETRMADGFPGDGWEPLIRRMSEKIEPFCVETDLHCAQMKEKLGRLRVYLEPRESIPDEVRAAVAAAVAESAQTCEGCGQPGEPRRFQWIRTLCNSCAAFAEEWKRRRFGNAPGDEEWRERFRSHFARLNFDDALRKWRTCNAQKALDGGKGVDLSVGSDDRYKMLLARRVPREQIVLGRAYVIHARNGGVGVAVEEGGHIGYRLHREKFGAHYLFTEWDWADDPNFGTAIPLKLIEAEPPAGDKELLAWVAAQEDEHRAEIDGAWETILGHPPRRDPPRRAPRIGPRR